jgi:hypothetical protein
LHSCNDDAFAFFIWILIAVNFDSKNEKLITLGQYS